MISTPIPDLSGAYFVGERSFDEDRDTLEAPVLEHDEAMKDLDDADSRDIPKHR